MKVKNITILQELVPNGFLSVKSGSNAMQITINNLNQSNVSTHI